MSSPGIRPRNNNPAVSPDGKTGAQTLRVLAEGGAVRAAVPSVVMPRAKTELSELLAGDALLCVRRRASAPSAQPSPASRDPSSPVPTVDADLARVSAAWPGLPRNIRAAMLAMIRETTAGEA